MNIDLTEPRDVAESGGNVDGHLDIHELLPRAEIGISDWDGADLEAPEEVCQASCTSKQCGDDGCDGTCGACEDELACTEDTCAEGKCEYSLALGHCVIDGTCFASGDSDPANPCVYCYPVVSLDDWTPFPDGKSCDEGGVCLGGVCCQAQENCTGKTCGADGCGGNCGECDSTAKCSDGECVPLPEFWAKTFPGTPMAGASDSQGNLFACGYFIGTKNFGGEDIVSHGDQDAWVVKLDPLGNHVWSAGFGAEENEQCWSAHADAAGNLLTSGLFYSQTVSFGGAQLPLTWGEDCPLPQTPARNSFVAKFDPTGQHLWSVSFDSKCLEHAGPVTLDSEGNAVVVGNYLWGAIDVGGGLFPHAGSSDIFVLKLDTEGHHVWSTHFGADIAERAEFVQTDPFGNILVAGRFNSPQVDLGGGHVLQNAEFDPPCSYTPDCHDSFVIKLDPNGTVLWAKSFGGPYQDYSQGLAVGPEGEVYVAGTFMGPWVNLGGQIYDNVDPDWLGDIFLLELDDNGQVVWAKTFSGGNVENLGSIPNWPVADPESLTVSDASELLMAGKFTTTSLDFGGGPIFNSTPAEICATLLPICEELFVARFDADGNHLWSAAAGGLEEESAVWAADLPDGATHLVGYIMDDQLDFTPLGLEETIEGYSGFAVKLPPQ